MEKQYETVKLTLPSVMLRWLSTKISNTMLCLTLIQDGEFVSMIGWINFRVGLERMCLVRRRGKV
jgi:hypothetical protein